MILRLTAVGVALAGLAAIGVGIAGAQPAGEHKPQAHEEHHAASASAGAPSAAAQAAFEHLKKLEGRWTGTGAHGAETMPAEVTYKVSGAGSAVIETEFPGTPHEMTTVYTVEGDAIRMTHYCSLANQPRMKVVPSLNSNVLKFEFTDAGNLASPDAPHMHNMTLTLVDDDHVKAEWAFFEGGKQTSTATFNLQRVGEQHGDMRFETFYVVILKHGAAWTPEETPESKKIFEGHMANIHKLADEGSLRLAGPFADKSGGMFVIKADSADAAKAMVDEDPAVKAGRLAYDIHPWLVEPGNVR